MHRTLHITSVLTGALLASCSSLGGTADPSLPTFIDRMPYVLPDAEQQAGMMVLAGTVQVRPPNTGEEGWRIATGPMRIPPGSDISTEPDAVAELLFPRGARVRLAPSTLLRVAHYPENAGMRDTNLRLYGGELWMVVPPDAYRPADFRVRTDHALAIVRSPEGATFVASSGPTRSSIFSASGTVLVQTDAEMERLTLSGERGVLVGGDGVTVRAGYAGEGPWYRWNSVRDTAGTGRLPAVEDLLAEGESDWVFDGDLVLPPLPDPAVDADAWFGEYRVPMDADAQDPADPDWRDPWQQWNTWDAWEDAPAG